MNTAEEIEARRKLLQEGGRTTVEITMQATIRQAAHFLEIGLPNSALRVLNGENGLAIGPKPPCISGISAEVLNFQICANACKSI